ncbi:Endonuclease V [Fodinibius salinus]|uniref:Endonuclease V n=1 Tax=Fodinibius salinus TaxID=860790 RepID=A0A5D3YSE7_9BACT|nr:deoxyribonuclease V [Fodinibius salinus]TYP95481.1 Endonuclease V [Fodinibius salinus]
MSGDRLDYYKTIDPTKAKKLQQELRQQISLEPLADEPQFVAGADISFNQGSNLMHAGIIILGLPDLNIVARSTVSDKTSFPYIPGLLAFRELPILLKAWDQLEQKPDVLILDGHGIAHPRRMGIATHLGIEIEHPTIGCAKNILTGSHDELSSQKGERVPLIDGSETVGMALRSRTNVNPVYVSPGHRLSSDDAYSVVMKCLTKYKLPRTTRLAHKWANKLRRGEAEEGYFKN